MSTHPALQTVLTQIADAESDYKGQAVRLQELIAARGIEKTCERRQMTTDISATVREAERDLQAMEAIPKPTADEKEVMKALLRLIGVADQLRSQAMEIEAVRREALAPRSSKRGAGVQRSTTRFGTGGAETESSGDEEGEEEGEDEDEEEPAPVPVVYLDGPDPKGVYPALGLTPDASQAEINKAIKKNIVLLHPDGHPNDPFANERYHNFRNVSCFVETEERRKQYDALQTVGELKQMMEELKIVFGSGN